MPQKNIIAAQNPDDKEMKKSEYINAISRFKHLIIITMVASVAVFIAVALFGGLSKVVSTIEGANAYLFAAAFVLVFAGMLTRFGRWSYCLKTLKIKIPFKKSFAAYMSLYSMDITPGRVGRIVAGYTINRVAHSKFMKVAPIITIDIFSDFVGFAILALVTSFVFHQFFWYVVVFVILLSISFVFLLHEGAYKLLRKSSFLRNAMNRFSSNINDYYSSQNLLNNKKVYVVALFYTIPAEIMDSMALYFSAVAISVKAFAAQSVFIYSVAQIFGMVSTLPGSVGVTDGTMVLLLGSTLNINAALSSAITIMTRLSTLWFSVIIGMIFFVYTLRYWNDEKKERHHPKSKQ
ncbi:MAG: flippase-like domain-containing protein [Candidatus Micrarchaeota archaeon]|nr:flippase-like domain-containing protein [Candidatus Micrarchaeota archaeon]